MYSDDLALFGVIIVIMFMFGAFSGYQLGISEIQQQAIEHNAALFCPTTGEFAWQGGCGNEN